jgi:hypothetical protein
MKKSLAIIAVALAFAPLQALAQERAGDAALGALSGIVLGPVGIVAGAVVGYTAGPSIASAWGVRRHRTHRGYAARHRTAAVVDEQSAAAAQSAPASIPAAPSAPASAPRAAPVPVQGFE